MLGSVMEVGEKTDYIYRGVFRVDLHRCLQNMAEVILREADLHDC